MASLRARHSRDCKKNGAGKGTTRFEDWPLAGCVCKPGPSYFIDYGVDPETGKHRVESVGRNRKLAEQGLRKRQTEQDEGSFRFRENIKFSAWADEWLASLRGKGSTRLSYATTLAYARAAFGSKNVRELSPADVRRFLSLVETSDLRMRKLRKNGKPPKQPNPPTPGTLAKHLRQLGACLSAAVAEGYAAENAVRRLHKSQRPKAAKAKPSYFTNAELARLWPAVADLWPEMRKKDDEPSFRALMYLHLFKLALATGMRSGELLALQVGDVSLSRNEIEVRRTLGPDGTESLPKSGETRTVDMTPAAVSVVGSWFKLIKANERGDKARLFETDKAQPLDRSFLTRGALYKAMEAAGIPREGEGGRPRTFHSLRHSFARIALESGAELTWTQRQLGHSSIVLTSDVYGHWSREAQKAQAARLEGAFPV